MDDRTFLSRLAQHMGCDEHEAEKLLKAFVAVIGDKAAQLDSVAIPSFGNFVAVKRNERVQKDATGGSTLVPPSVTLEFLASAILRAQLKP